MVSPLDEFIEACAKGEVIVLGKAEKTARSEFHLLSKASILEFIGDGNLENVKHRGSKPFDKNPLFTVYAYNFFSGKKYGYIAIFCGENQQWFLKSFKKNWDKDPREIPFSQPMGLIAKIGELK
jgi:hypothetical protein